MNNERFAQGEWTVNEKIMVAVNCGQKHIALVNIYNDGTDKSVLKDECLANAHLISAAPDMYRALQSLMEEFGDFEDDGSGLIGWNESMKDKLRKAKAALTKADGEPK